MYLLKFFFVFFEDDKHIIDYASDASFSRHFYHGNKLLYEPCQWEKANYYPPSLPSPQLRHLLTDRPESQI